MSNNMMARAWLKNQKVMTDINSLYFTDNTISGLSGKELNFESTTESRVFYTESIDNAVIMLASGLTDKHGKPIYMDSDVVKLTITHDTVASEKAPTVYIDVVTMQDYMLTVDGFGLFNLIDFYLDCYEFEILGNIYENPELLGEVY